MPRIVDGVLEESAESGLYDGERETAEGGVSGGGETSMWKSDSVVIQVCSDQLHAHLSRVQR